VVGDSFSGMFGDNPARFDALAEWWRSATCQRYCATTETLPSIPG